MRNARVAVVSIGINYAGQPGELRGCINDSKNFLKFVDARFKRHIRYRVQLVDTMAKNDRRYPTRANIEQQLRGIATLCRKEHITHVWLHYSGHGGQQRDKNGDERDGVDETLVPVDHASKGMITDDWLLDNFINRIPARTMVFGLIDACHSASMLDLKYQLDPVANNRFRRSVCNTKKPMRGTAVLISGCKDSKVSYDTWDRTFGACGAMTSAFLKQVIRRRHAPLATIVRLMRADIRGKGYPQIPQISATAPLRGHEKIFGIGHLK